MPPAGQDRWMSHDTTTAQLFSLLRPFPADDMEVVKVGSAVNRKGCDGPECLNLAD